MTDDGNIRNLDDLVGHLSKLFTQAKSEGDVKSCVKLGELLRKILPGQPKSARAEPPDSNRIAEIRKLMQGEE